MKNGTGKTAGAAALMISLLMTGTAMAQVSADAQVRAGASVDTRQKADTSGDATTEGNANAEAGVDAAAPALALPDVDTGAVSSP